MRYLFIILTFLHLAACQNMQQGDTDFYTWVDETGQIRTIKKQPAAAKKEQVATSPDNLNQGDNSFDPNDFTPSQEVDKKLNNEKLYAWQEPSGAQIVRQESISQQEPKPVSIAPESTLSKSFRVFREGTQVSFDDIDGISISLARYYQYSDAAETDYALLEFLSPIERIDIKSFIKNDTVAMPRIIPLTKSFNQNFSFDNPFEFREEESWHGYGFVYGVLDIPPDTKYLLLLPNPQSGVFEAEGKLIKQSNLGSLVFTKVK